MPESIPSSATSYVPIDLQTDRGLVGGRYWPATGARAGVLMVGGVGGGWDSPAQDLYSRLGHELSGIGISALRVRYRNPRDLEEAVADVLEGIQFLEESNVERIGLVGHSFGGAVVIRAAAQARRVRTVVTLATQAFGTTPVRGFGDSCSLLALHGKEDDILPYACSVHVTEESGGPSKLVLLEGSGHGLDEEASLVHDEVLDWLTSELSLAP